jgi:hypothetical protein
VKVPRQSIAMQTCSSSESAASTQGAFPETTRISHVCSRWGVWVLVGEALLVEPVKNWFVNEDFGQQTKNPELNRLQHLVEYNVVIIYVFQQEGRGV